MDNLWPWPWPSLQDCGSDVDVAVGTAVEMRIPAWPFRAIGTHQATKRAC